MSLVIAEVGYAEPWWIQIIKAILIFAVGLQLIPLVLLTERKMLGRFQRRYGPNRVGPFGALQPLADIIKLATKEQFQPRTAVGFMFMAAPAISIITAVATLAIVPFGDVVDIFGTKVGLYGVDPSIGILYAFAFGGISFYGLMLGGWASGSKYSFLGAMRSAAQLISYEVSQGISLVGVLMMAGTMSLNVIVVSAVTTTVYLGGWLLPFGWHTPGWAMPFVVIGKTTILIFFFMWVRATLPRLRYDQLMTLGWKVLLPIATINTLVTAVLVVS